MKILILTVSLISAALASDVLEFSDSDFASGTADAELMLVEFFAPWCGHCKKLAPEYEKAATKLKENDPPVPLAKVDCTANADLCSKYGVSGYPTLKIFRNGEVKQDYDGGRDATGIIKKMKSMAGPTSKELDSVDAVKKFLSSSPKEFVIVGFFEDKDSDLAKVFKKTADSLSTDLKFGHVHGVDAVLKEYGKEEIILYRPKHLQSKFEDAALHFDGGAKEHKLKSWVQENQCGLCGHRTTDTAEKYDKKPLFVALYDVDYEKNEKGTNYWRNRVMKVAKKLKDAGKKAYFAVSSKNDFAHELSEFGMESVSGDKPVVIARDSRDRKFSMQDEFSMDNLEKFVNDVLDDKVEPYLKSEPIPEPNDEPVKVVVAKNFDEIVNDKDKDVLIEFYAPWCGHCKSLAPKYDELAEKLKDEPSITIAKMDATANDVGKPYEVRGFPTIYYAPKNSKDNPKTYNGGREVKDFIDYLAKESTDGFKGYDRKGKKVKSKKTEL